MFKGVKSQPEGHNPSNKSNPSTRSKYTGGYSDLLPVPPPRPLEQGETIHDLVERIKILEFKINHFRRLEYLPADKKPEELLDTNIENLKNKLSRQLEVFIEDYFTSHLADMITMVKDISTRLQVESG